MTDIDEDGLAEFNPELADAAPAATRKALEAVTRCRAHEDEREGYFRDYPDRDSASLSLWSADKVVEASAARGRTRPWFSQLMHAIGIVWACLTPLRVESSPALRTALVNVASVAVAWVEALDHREMERIAMRPESRWSRLKRWFLARLGRANR